MSDQQQSQPWVRSDGPPDREFFRSLIDEVIREGREREQRLFNRLDWLILRWMLICFVVGLVLGLGYLALVANGL